MDFGETFANYVLRHHRSRILQILYQPELFQSYPVVINFFTLFEEEIELGDALLNDPDEILGVFRRGILLAEEKLLGETTITSQNSSDGTSSMMSTYGDKQMNLKSLVHARIFGLPAKIQENNKLFPGNDDVGLFIQISGTVVRVTIPSLQEYEREYFCLKCKATQFQEAEYEMCNALLPPNKCVNGCAGAKFMPVKSEGGQERIKDYQEIRLQEEPRKLHLGAVPSSIWVTLDYDLVDMCHPGDHITVWGTVKRRWRSAKFGMTSDVELVFKGNNLQVTNHQKAAQLVTEEFKTRIKDFWGKHQANPLTGRDVILASFCPDVYGLYLLKLALSVVLCGGTRRDDNNIRAESHMLMVGDPGTGKSHLLRFAAKVCSRSVLTTGVGSTTAGLTVCAVKEGADWQLEAGALVLADGGICCIDELNTMREHDRTSLHEAMEQQTISVAKAGMVSKISTKCSVLAASNAKHGGYDPNESISVNTALASPLLSRFDLVFVLQDSRDPDWDRLLSSYILNLTAAPNRTDSNELWSVEEMQTYFSYARTLMPSMSSGAHMVLTRYYQAQRAAEVRNASRTTVRMLESLARLSQGHARLMLRDEVTIEDAVITVTLMECSMGTSALIGQTDALHASFPEDPTQLYRKQATLVLQRLELDELLSPELSRLDGLLEIEVPALPRRMPEPRPEDREFLLTQRLGPVWKDIQKKKELETVRAATMFGQTKGQKRKREIKRVESATDDKKTTKKKRVLLISDSESDDGIRDPTPRYPTPTPGEMPLTPKTPELTPSTPEPVVTPLTSHVPIQTVTPEERETKASPLNVKKTGESPEVAKMLRSDSSFNESFGTSIDVSSCRKNPKKAARPEGFLAKMRRKATEKIDIRITDIQSIREVKNTSNIKQSTLSKLMKFKKPPSPPKSTVRAGNLDCSQVFRGRVPPLHSSTPVKCLSGIGMFDENSDDFLPKKKSVEKKDSEGGGGADILADDEEAKRCPRSKSTSKETTRLDPEEAKKRLEKLKALARQSKALSQTSQRWALSQSQKCSQPISQCSQSSKFTLNDVEWGDTDVDFL